MTDLTDLKNLINPSKTPDKNFFLDLLDDEKQQKYEDEHMRAVMVMLKALYLAKLKRGIEDAKAEKKKLAAEEGYNAESYRKVLELNAVIARLKAKCNTFKAFFEEPYFARMDLTDPKEGYNSYYIGKHGDAGLEIVDWRAPLARKYYQKSRTSFSINDYDYKLILRRAIRALNGRLVDFKNEYLCLTDYLSAEEIGGRGEELIFDPYLKEILKSRKEKQEITDIIETIQEKQYEIITLPEDEQFVLQGVAGSGKTMILLHRLSSIMYNNDKIRQSDVLVITPSDSFNSFIDELSAVLELEKVKTSTLGNYFSNMLKNAGIDLGGKIDLLSPVPAAYSDYIYSKRFQIDVERKLAKVYDGVYGMFASADAEEVVNAVSAACRAQEELYNGIKNASLRVRRCVLGEIKEKPDGGLYYTKQFRYMFNCVQETAEFLRLVKEDERMGGYAFFYRQLLSFYKSAKYLRRYSLKICLAAMDDLRSLAEIVKKEITDLKRYRIKLGPEEILTYSVGIEKREQLLVEIEDVSARVEKIKDGFSVLYDFTDVLRQDETLVSIGKCENTQDILKYFNREILKKAKMRAGIPSSPLLYCDLFALSYILVKLGCNLSPKYSFLFIDEAQDISPAEYETLRAVNDRAVFNVFGDLRQNVTPGRGIHEWAELGFKVYNLSLNYRNTNQIVEFVARKLGIDMRSIGLNGAEVEYIDRRSVSGYLSGKNGLRAIICSEKNLPAFTRKSYNLPALTGKISKTKINLMTVYQSKGLEFTAVAVADSDLSVNEKYIAYTRALKELAIIK